MLIPLEDIEEDLITNIVNKDDQMNKTDIKLLSTDELVDELKSRFDAFGIGGVKYLRDGKITYYTRCMGWKYAIYGVADMIKENVGKREESYWDKEEYS